MSFAVQDAEVKIVDLPEVSDSQLEQLERRRVPDWLRCPLFFTKDSKRGELKHRKSGDIAKMTQQIAENAGTTFRLSVFWGGDAYYQSKVAPHAPGLGEIDYLSEALSAGRQSGVRIIAYMNPNCLYDDHDLYRECAIRDSGGDLLNFRAYGREHC